MLKEKDVMVDWSIGEVGCSKRYYFEILVRMKQESRRNVLFAILVTIVDLLLEGSVEDIEVSCVLFVFFETKVVKIEAQ